MPEHVPSTQLYNKHLEPPANVCEVPDSIGGRISGETLIEQSDGAWQWAPEPADPEPGLAPEPVEYVPVEKTTKSTRGRKSSAKSEEG
jgi:hypothetical protein